MPWVRKADLRSTVPGPQGPDGIPGVNAVANDTATAGYIDTAGTSLTKTALLKNGLTGWLHIEGFGGDPTGATNSTTALQDAIDAAAPGDTIYFGNTGSGAGYEIDGDTIEITTPSIRFLASPRDAYTTSIRCSDPSTTMIKVKAPGFVLENIGLWGDADTASLSAGSNGEGATITGLELFGDTDGNVDAAIRGATLQYLALGVLLHGRNTEISQNTLFNNCLAGVRHTGTDTYHTGPAADQNRGNVIRDCRFHNIGTTSATAAIEFTAASKVLHLIIDGNHIDSTGLGKPIVITGTAVDPARGVSIFNAKLTEIAADGITLTYCQYPIVSGAVITGIAGGTGDGIVLTNCLYPVISDFIIRLMGRDGIRGTNNDSAQIGNGKIIQVGQSGSFVGNGMTFDSTNANIRVHNVDGHAGDGWFFEGSPTGMSALTDCSHASFTLGGINSTTVLNRSSRGLNTYVEGKFGRIEDVGYQCYDFSAGVAKTVATVAASGTFSPFILEIEVAGNTAGNLVGHLLARRLVNPANGTPVVTTLGTDAANLVALSIVTAGTTRVSVVVTPTNALFGSVKVRTSAVGATNGTNRREAVITMA